MARRSAPSPPRGQALLELAIATPLILLIILGGISVGLLLLTRMELQHAAQEAAIAGAESDCAGALGVVPQILGFEPDSKSCDVTGQVIEVTLSDQIAETAPFIPLPNTVTVSGRAMVRPSPSPSP